MELRPYQKEALNGANNALRQSDSALGVMACGGGKTTIFSILINHCTQGWGGWTRGGRVLILVNRRNLLRQTAIEVQRVAGIIPALEQAEHHAPLHASVVVASIDTLKNRLTKYPTDHFALMVIDEAHLMVGKTAQKIFNYFKCKRLGVTATPHNKGKRALAKFYERVAFDIPLLRLIKEGWLAPITVAMSPLKIDISSVKMKHGDLDTSGLSSSITPYFDAIAQEMTKHPHRKWLCFLPVIRSSIEFAELLNLHGFRAAHVDGEHDPTVALEQFRLGKLNVLTCSQLLYFGHDEPSIDGIVNLRQTKSINFYEQLIGRGTRKSEDTLKHELLVLDFLWQYADMGLVRPSFVLSRDDAEANEIQRRVERSTGAVDLVSTQEAVERDIHAKLQEKLRENAKKKRKLINILDLIDNEETQELCAADTPDEAQSDPASMSQRMVLERHGLDPDDFRTKPAASRAIDWLHSRIEMGLASVKQLRLLKRIGVKCDLTTTFKAASYLLDQRLPKKKGPQLQLL